MNIGRLKFLPRLVEEVRARRKDVTRRLIRYVQCHECDHEPAGCPPEPEDTFRGFAVGDLLWVPERWRVAEPQCFIQYPGRARACRWTTPKWMSPGTMPRWAARLWLSMVSTRQELLQEITEEDAVLEGFVPSKVIPAREQFMHKWEAIYANSSRVADVGWKDNPVVWRVEFDPITVDRALELMKKAGLKP